MTVELSIDGGPAVSTELRNADRQDWIAGPVPLAAVEVSRGDHQVRVLSGEREGWEATAGHGISNEDREIVYLNGREALSPPDDGPN